MKCNNQHKSTWEGRLLCHYRLWLWPHKLPKTLKNYSKVVPGALKCDAKGTKHQYMSWDWDQVCRRISESSQPTPAPFCGSKKLKKMLFCLVDFFYLFWKYFFGDVFSPWWRLRSVTPRPKAQKVTVVCLLCCFMFRKFHRSSFCQVFQCLKRCRERVFVCLCRPLGKDKSLLELAPDISR